MPDKTSLDSLNLVQDDLLKEINFAINALDSYLQIKDNNKALIKSINHLSRSKNIFNIFEMKGAQLLVIESIALIKSLTKHSSHSVISNQLDIVSTSLVHLSHYVEYISQKQKDIPEILIPVINDIRKAIGKPANNEAIFFDFDINQASQNGHPSLNNNIDNIAQSRYFRQIYQIGLIEVLRKTNTRGGINMMIKALKKLETHCTHQSFNLFWWIAQAALIGFRENKLSLTSLRMKILSSIDREIKHIEYDHQLPLETAIINTNQLAKNMLYLLSLIEGENAIIDEVKTHFNVSNSPFSEIFLQHEFINIKKPSNNDFKSIGNTLIEEIDIIEGSVLFDKQGSFSADDMYESIKSIKNLNNLLKILHIENETLRLSRMIIIANKAVEEGVPLKDNEQKVLLLVLSSIKKLIAEDRLGNNSIESQKTSDKLTLAAEEIRQLGHKKIKRIMSEIHIFIENRRKVLLLQNIPELINDVSHAFEKLGVTATTSILSRVSLFVENHLMRHPKKISNESLEFFADIVGSLEFYLETLEQTTTPSIQILEFAQASLKQLNRINQVKYT